SDLRRREDALVAQLPERTPTCVDVLRRRAPQVVLGYALRRQAFGHDRERLCRRSFLGGHVARRHGSLHDRKERRTAETIEQEQVTGLAARGDCGTLRAG